MHRERATTVSLFSSWRLAHGGTQCKPWPVGAALRDQPADFVFAVCCLRLVPLTERVIEGGHAKVHKGLVGGRRKTNRGATTVSLASGRFAEFKARLQSRPSTFNDVAGHMDAVRNPKLAARHFGLEGHPAFLNLLRASVANGESSVHVTRYERTLKECFYRLSPHDQYDDLRQIAATIASGLNVERSLRISLEKSLYPKDTSCKSASSGLAVVGNWKRGK